MKKIQFFVIFLFLAAAASAQSILPKNKSLANPLERNLLLAASAGQQIDFFEIHAAANTNLTIEDIAAYKNEIIEFVSKIQEKGIQANQEHLLKSVFYKTHKKFLKKYTSYSTFGDLLENGNYDCLTGTIVYSYILNQLEIPHNIIETDYHIYLSIKSGEKTILFESTDPLEGFIADQPEVEFRLTNQKKLRENLMFDELVGLQYYNSAVAAYNAAHYALAVDQIEKSTLFYSGDRLQEFGTILAKAISISDMEQENKVAYLMKLTKTLNEGPILASLN